MSKPEVPVILYYGSIPEQFKELVKSLPILELIMLRHTLKTSEEDIVFLAVVDEELKTRAKK